MNELALFAGAGGYSLFGLMCYNQAMKSRYTYGKEKTCPVCKSTFRKRDADSDSYVARYCSHACRNKARTKHTRQKCKQCGVEFKPRREGHVFCSRYCSGAYKKENHKPSKESVINKKMAAFCCGAIHRCLRNKTNRTAHLIGYSAQDLKGHLENYFQAGMSWENYGKGEGQWSIDHSRPISSFPDSATVAEINDLDNLRPMWHKRNCSKGKKWERQ